MSPPRCPRCESHDAELKASVLEAGDRSEDVHATHECRQCRTPYRYTPPDGEKHEAHLTT
jgi:hypothetical protein